jgi:hypothetical protein
VCATTIARGLIQWATTNMDFGTRYLNQY